MRVAAQSTATRFLSFDFSNTNVYSYKVVYGLDKVTF